MMLRHGRIDVAGTVEEGEGFIIDEKISVDGSRNLKCTIERAHILCDIKRSLCVCEVKRKQGGFRLLVLMGK